VGERHLTRGEYVAPSGQGDVFAAARGEPQPAVERHDEGERLVQLGSCGTGKPALKNSAGVDDDRPDRRKPVVEFRRTDIAVRSRTFHRATIASHDEARRTSYSRPDAGELTCDRTTTTPSAFSPADRRCRYG
jgi:hypothetical protein